MLNTQEGKKVVFLKYKTVLVKCIQIINSSKKQGTYIYLFLSYLS